MANTQLVLAIDQGGQSSRVAVYTIDGKQLHCFSSPCATVHRQVDGVNYIEQNPLDILGGIKECLAHIEEALGDHVNAICAAGFAGQGSSMLCWDNQTGEALSPVISWQDVRGDTYLNAIPLTHAQAQAITGLRVSAHYGASKIRWCLDHNERVMQAQQNNTLSIGPIVSFIFWHLCETGNVDPGHAQRTLLWNLATNNWDDYLLRLFNIPQAILPECKYHNNHFGDVRLGQHFVPFTASARDQGASLFARGLPEREACYINIGTGAFIQRVSQHLQAPDGLLVSPLWLPKQRPHLLAVEVSSPTCYMPEFIAPVAIQGTRFYAWEATVNGAASALEFMRQQTGMAVTPADIRDALQAEPAGECYFLNAVGGLSAPYWRNDLKSIFSKGLSAHEKILAWLESILFQIAVNIKLMGDLPQKIYISGGFSNADTLCQKFADLLGVPVHRSENTDATLQGIAYMAAGLPSVWAACPAEEVFHPRENILLRKRFICWQERLAMWIANN